MIGRMRPFYQAHWDISKDIKHVWLLICTYYIAWIFQWILGDERRRKWWDRQYRVWIPQCAAPLDVTVTYARDSFVDSPAGPFVFSRGGPDILDVTVTYARDSFCGFTGWYPGTSLTQSWPLVIKDVQSSIRIGQPFCSRIIRVAMARKLFLKW